MTYIYPSRSKIVQAEISHYKGTPAIRLRDKPLQWWNLNKHILPNLAKLAHKCLSIVATSVPSERLFSVAGNIMGAKRVALLLWKHFKLKITIFLFT